MRQISYRVNLSTSYSKFLERNKSLDFFKNFTNILFDLLNCMSFFVVTSWQQTMMCRCDANYQVK